VQWRSKEGSFLKAHGVQRDGHFKIPATPNTLQSSDFPSAARLSEMDKKEIESPKLTANFLLWIGLFLLAMFLLIAHFAWHFF
jgi:ABC-type uncharacterized transport system permease subunit